MQVGHVGRREQRPVAAFDDALHEQVGDPVRRVHVVRAAAVVAGVLAQLEELLDVEVPRLEVRAHGALALAAVMRESGHGHVRLVDVDLQSTTSGFGVIACTPRTRENTVLPSVIQFRLAIGLHPTSAAISGTAGMRRSKARRGRVERDRGRLATTCRRVHGRAGEPAR